MFVVMTRSALNGERQKRTERNLHLSEERETESLTNTVFCILSRETLVEIHSVVAHVGCLLNLLQSLHATPYQTTYWGLGLVVVVENHHIHGKQD